MFTSCILKRQTKTIQGPWLKISPPSLTRGQRSLHSGGLFPETPPPQCPAPSPHPARLSNPAHSKASCHSHCTSQPGSQHKRYQGASNIRYASLLQLIHEPRGTALERRPLPAALYRASLCSLPQGVAGRPCAHFLWFSKAGPRGRDLAPLGL